MMTKLVQILVFACFSRVLCVPPSPTSAITDMLRAEFGTTKNTIKVLSDQWEKWNTLFLTSLEPRIASTASTVASIDSNIHNLQERAHVWDTFQLHVSAWNEQLSSLDRKIDIISKGQEKILNLDGKINAILSMEYKLDNTIKILNNLYDSVTNLDTAIHTKKSHDVLFSEFATRGVLSSIKLVEKKLDRLLIANQNNLLKTKVNDEKPKLTIKCNTPRIVEEALNDISSKVDVIFDNISSVRDDGDEDDYDNDYLDIEEGSGTTPDFKNQSRNKRLKEAIRKQCLNYKQTKQALEEIMNRAIRIENTSLVILDKENIHFEKLSKYNSECKVMDSARENCRDFTNNINLILESYFNEQRAHFESVSSRLIRNYNSNREATNCNSTDVQPATPSIVNFSNPVPTPESRFAEDLFDVTTASSTLFDINEGMVNSNQFSDNPFEAPEYDPQPTWKAIVNENISSCEDLDNTANSGVYIFTGNGTEIPFNKRYCEIREDGIWTVIQRRDNYTAQHNFNGSWNNYKYGFGDLHRDFWMGNDYLSTLSKNSALILRVELEDFENHSTWAEYNTFEVLSENENYRLEIGGYVGNASDSFSGHNGSEFSTYDRINDVAPECCPCAVSYGGGWWFNRCFESNLNGIYHRKPKENDYFRGIIWEHWLGNYSLKKTVMMVKSKRNNNAKNPLLPKLPDSVRVDTIPYSEEP